MCSELTMMLDKVSSIIPSIETAQPGCKAGIEELCNLYNIVDKGKLIIQNCIECSSLYLVCCSLILINESLCSGNYNDSFVFILLFYLRLFSLVSEQLLSDTKFAHPRLLQGRQLQCGAKG